MNIQLLKGPENKVAYINLHKKINSIENLINWNMHSDKKAYLWLNGCKIADKMTAQNEGCPYLMDNKMN